MQAVPAPNLQPLARSCRDLSNQARFSLEPIAFSQHARAIPGSSFSNSSWRGKSVSVRANCCVGCQSLKARSSGRRPHDIPKRGATARPQAHESEISPARASAFRVLLRLEEGKSHSDDLLRGKAVKALSSADVHLATALVLGVLRWQIQLDAQLQVFLARPGARLDTEVRIALRLAHCRFCTWTVSPHAPPSTRALK